LTLLTTNLKKIHLQQLCASNFASIHFSELTFTWLDGTRVGLSTNCPVFRSYY